MPEVLDLVVERTGQRRRNRTAEANRLDPSQRAGHTTWPGDDRPYTPSVQIASPYEALDRAVADLRRTAIVGDPPLRAAARLCSLEVTGTSMPNPSTLIHTRFGFLAADFVANGHPPIIYIGR